MLPKKVKTHLSKDPVVKELIKNLDMLQLAPSGNVFNELVKNIVYQQISYKAADKIYGRFIELMPDIDYKPSDILSYEPLTIKAVGLSTQKMNYIFNIANFFKERKLYHFNWQEKTDQEITGILTEIKGVGTWTVDMILMFELNRPDIWPVKDAAIQQAMIQLYGIKKEKKALIDEMYKLAEPWKPFRSYTTLYLWAWCRENLKKKKSAAKK